MSLWPGDDHFSERYDYSTEYVTVMQDVPHHKIELVGAGQSDRGMAFCAEHGDYAFCIAAGINAPQANVALSKRFARKA
jgi:pyrimidine oxygenase